MKHLLSYTLLVMLLFVNNTMGVNKKLMASVRTYKLEGRYNKFTKGNKKIFLKLHKEKREVDSVKSTTKIVNLEMISKSEFKKMASERESRGLYNVANEFKYVGKYQMGRIAFRDIGYSKGRIDSIQNSVYFELNSKGKKLYYFDTTLFTPEEQERAICKMYHNIEKKYLRRDIKRYVGKYVGGIYITKAGILGASMLGCGYVDDYLKSNGRINPKDAYGTSVRSRLKMFQKVELRGCF